MNRRSFLTGLLAAPAIIPVNNLMKLRGIILRPPTFMTVTLVGHSHPVWVPNATLPGYTIQALVKTIEVPWLGSVRDTMEWYDTELEKLDKTMRVQGTASKMADEFKGYEALAIAC